MDNQSVINPTSEIKPATTKPTKRTKLTYKQRIFIDEFVKTKNATKSALKAYDVKSKDVARQMGSENLSKPYIVNKIDQLMKQAHYNPVNSIRNVMKIENKASKYRDTYGHSLNASKILLGINGLLIEKSQNTTLNMNIDSLDPHDLLILKKKYDKLLEG